MSNTVEVCGTGGQFTIDRMSGQVLTELPSDYRHIMGVNPDTIPPGANTVDILVIGYWYSGYESPAKQPPAAGEIDKTYVLPEPYIAG